jgi:hypothetical protein
MPAHGFPRLFADFNESRSFSFAFKIALFVGAPPETDFASR